MTPSGKPLSAAVPVHGCAHGAEIAAAGLLGRLAAHAQKPLVFEYDGRAVRPGYHVTEVKAGAFASLDCGANPEEWRETIVQLWDVEEGPDRSWMPVGKFLAIMRKVAERVPFDPEAKLTFEVSDGLEAIRLFAAASVETGGDTVRVRLERRPASCKPRDRWLETQAPKASACCGPSTQAAACCA